MPARGASQYNICPGIEYASKHGVPVFLMSGSHERDDEGFAFRIGYITQVEAIRAGAIPLERPVAPEFVCVIETLGGLIGECGDMGEL